MRPLSQSQRRLRTDMHRLLSQLIQTEISDPRLIGMSITRVESTSSGYGLIIRVHRMKADPVDCERGLNRLAPHFMHLLRHALPRRRLPKIRFQWDEAMDRGGDVIQLLNDLKGGEA